MEAAKNATAEKATVKIQKTTATTQKKAGEYKVIGEGFREKSEAGKRLKEVSRKGFKDAGLMVRDNEFVILFGTYGNEHMAKANAEAIVKAGFEAQIVGA